MKRERVRVVYFHDAFFIWLNDRYLFVTVVRIKLSNLVQVLPNQLHNDNHYAPITLWTKKI